MISVIIPAYNAGAFLKRAIDSVFEQTYKDFEIIVVDDGSTDGSITVCDKRVNIYTQTNSGVSVARNYGMSLAKGELIFFLDADDYISPNALELLYNGWKEYACPITIGGVLKITPQGNFYKVPRPTHIGMLYEKEIIDSVVDYLKTHNNFAVSHCWGRLYEKSFIDTHNIRFVDGLKVGEDGAFNVRCLAFADKILVTDEPLYYFQLHKESSSVKAIAREALDISPLHKALDQFFAFKVLRSVEELKMLTMEWGKKMGNGI